MFVQNQGWWLMFDIGGEAAGEGRQGQFTVGGGCVSPMVAVDQSFYIYKVTDKWNFYLPSLLQWFACLVVCDVINDVPGIFVFLFLW